MVHPSRQLPSSVAVRPVKRPTLPASDSGLAGRPPNFIKVSYVFDGGVVPVRLGDDGLISLAVVRVSGQRVQSAGASVSEMFTSLSMFGYN